MKTRMHQRHDPREAPLNRLQHNGKTIPCRTKNPLRLEYRKKGRRRKQQWYAKEKGGSAKRYLLAHH